MFSINLETKNMFKYFQNSINLVYILQNHLNTNIQLYSLDLLSDVENFVTPGLFTNSPYIVWEEEEVEAKKRARYKCRS